jgi:hypothetical protein
MVKSFYFAAVVSPFILCGCATGEADFVSPTLKTTRIKEKENEYKLLGTYYSQVENEILLSTTGNKPNTQNGDLGLPGGPPGGPPGSTTAPADSTSAAIAAIARAAGVGDARSGLGTPTPASASVSVASYFFPQKPRYLYLHKNPLLFNESANLSTTTLGLLSATDTQSQQELTTVLGEIAKVAGAGNALYSTDLGQREKDCITSLPKNWSFRMRVYSDADETTMTDHTLTEQAKKAEDSLNKTLGKDPKVKYRIRVNVDNVMDPAAKHGDICESDEHKPYDGFCAYEPTPIKIELQCSTDQFKDNIYDIITPYIGNIYKYSHVENPQRGFLTSPHDSYTMQDGVIIGHKYTSQSYAKGVFDFVTTPIRSALPSTTTSTQVQTGGGKPDQTTQTTTYVFNPN